MLMRAGKMPRSWTRVEDWARAETFAKRSSLHDRISAELEQPLGSAKHLDGEGLLGKRPETGRAFIGHNSKLLGSGGRVLEVVEDEQE
jgi:hypothetical protein